MATGVPNSSAANEQERIARNRFIRDLIVSSSIDLCQEIDTITHTTYTPGQRSVFNTRVKPVGLLKRFYVHITGTIAGQTTAGNTQRTPLGLSNILSNVILTDLNNQVRIQTPGWHLHALATIRRGWPFGAAYAPTIDSGGGIAFTPVIDGNLYPMQVGDTLGLMKGPRTVAAAGTGDFEWFYEIPVCYSDTDLTGAIWANTQNASMNLQLELNPDFFVTSAQDNTLACYQSDEADITGNDVTTITIKIYQHVLDQLPVDPNTGMVLLPSMDLEKGYLINNTVITGLSANVKTALPYANWRQFMSTVVLYDGNTAAGLRPITDVSRVSLQSANFTNFFDISPQLQSMFCRNRLMADMPEGVYYFDHRNKPIVTQQYGNMELQIQPIAPPAGAKLHVGYESIALLNLMNMAGSIFQG